MKKFKYLYIIVFFAIFNLNYVSAETYKCEYEFKEGGPTYIFEFDTTNVTGKITNEEQSTEGFSLYYYNYSYTYHFYSDEIQTYEVNICPILYMASNVTNADSITIYEYHIYSDSYLREEGGNDCVSTRGQICLKNFLGSFTYYYTGVLTDSEINKNKTLKSICPTYDIIETNIKNAYSEFSNCSGNNCMSYMNIAAENMDKLRNYCTVVLKYEDYYIENESGETIRDECINSCLNFSKKINDIKSEYGVQNVSGSCGFSGRLIIWVANIVRWIKYIIPVAVIVLGILDFIKAVGADKDDEMKKAQGRFVKRLIAAALIFIVPFIIEFVLDKMGFAANGCGIIDL